METTPKATSGTAVIFAETRRTGFDTVTSDGRDVAFLVAVERAKEAQARNLALIHG